VLGAVCRIDREPSQPSSFANRGVALYPQHALQQRQPGEVGRGGEREARHASANRTRVRWSCRPTVQTRGRESWVAVCTTGDVYVGFMRVVCTTLVGLGTEHLVDDALSSAKGLYDLAVVIDTRPVDSKPLVFRHTVQLERWEWTGSFADARNASLQFAAKYCADFALTLDTDERLNLGPRSEVERFITQHPDSDMFLVSSADGQYCKERFLRLANGPQWVGPAHEAVVYGKDPPGLPFSVYGGGGVRTVMPGTFDELPKSSETLEAKYRRDIDLLTAWLAADKNRAECRWHRYIGETWFALGDWVKAHEAFLLAMHDLKAWREERAWSCFMSACCLSNLGCHEQALEAAGFTLVLHSGFGRETGWIAGYCAENLGWHELALEWALLSIHCPPASNRELKHLGALRGAWEGAHRALVALGRHDDAKRASEERARL
jgi:hypothetical protein